MSDDPAQDPQPGVGGFLYKLALAGVGGLLLAQEEITGMLRRGTPPPADAEAGSADGDASGEAAATASDEAPACEPVDATVDRVLRTLNVPSRAQVDELSRAVDALAARVAALQRTRS